MKKKFIDKVEQPITLEVPKIDENVLTLEHLTKTLENVFGNKEIHNDLLTYPKHYAWEENGIKYSSWEISKGVFTGDGGMELFSKMVEKEFKNLPFKFFLKESSHDKPIT